jgi:DNA-binding IclR family transcriptional regulator
VFQLAAAWNADDLATLGEATVAELGRKTGEAAQLAVFDRRNAIVVFSQGIRCLSAAQASTVMRFAQRLSRELGYRGAYPRPLEDPA